MVWCSVRVPAESEVSRFPGSGSQHAQGSRAKEACPCGVSASILVRLFASPGKRAGSAGSIKWQASPSWVGLPLLRTRNTNAYAPPIDLPIHTRAEQADRIESNRSEANNPTSPSLSSVIALGAELAASNSKLEKAGPVRGVTAGEGDEIGIDPPLPEASSETPEQRNKFLVLRLYEALDARDHAAVQSLLAPDLEWWFHGPPKHQHMMRLLTGGSGGGFRFVPRSVDALGASTSTVIAEGHDGRCYWVHAWTVGPDGVITQLREYFNTDLTVTRLAAVAASAKCVWQSRRPDSATNSLPGLLLAL